MDTRRFGVAQTAADMCQVTEENIMEFAERMNRFGEGVFSRLAEIKRQKLEAGESVVDLSIGAPNIPPGPSTFWMCSVRKQPTKAIIFTPSTIRRISYRPFPSGMSAAMA